MNKCEPITPQAPHPALANGGIRSEACFGSGSADCMYSMCAARSVVAMTGNSMR
jgi:hypothetical protein